MATNALRAKTPAYATGKICYIEIPAKDVQQSADFYQRAFGWSIRSRSDGATSFDDSVNEVSGTWVVDRPPMKEAGLMIYVMVADAGKAIEDINAAGGKVIRPVDAASREVFAWFSDPAGNVMGIYQQPGLKS